MAETYHKIGAIDYKVDHDAKVVYRKESVFAHAHEVEKAQHPDGFKWLTTGGDYDGFIKKFPQEAAYTAPDDPVAPAQIITDDLESDSAADDELSQDSFAPDEFTKARKLKSK